MYVQLNLPQEIVKCVEYIPEKELPGILVAILKQSILNKGDTNESNNKDSAELILLGMQEQFQMLKEELGKVVQPANMREEPLQDTNVYQGKIEENVICKITQIADVDSDLDDYLDLLK